MKVLQLIQRPQLRGAEIFASQLTSHINGAGHKGVLVSLFPGNSRLPHADEILTLNGTPERRMWDIKAWKKLSVIIATEQPDIIQANAGDTLMYAVFSKVIYGWKQPIVFRNASTISLYIKTWVAKKWHGIFFRFTDKVISVSNTSAVDFTTIFPTFKNKIITIPIGIENTVAYSDVRSLEQINKPVLQGNPTIIHVGGFTFEKNHTGLISIFQRLLKEVVGAKLHLVGDGPLKKEIEEAVTAQKLTSNITFHGFQANALQFIRDADVLVLPSHIEGLPGVILEAFYCNTAVVAYDVGGIKEILVNDVTGRLIQKGDEKAFVKAILDSLEKTDENKLLLKNAHHLVVTKYLNKQISGQFLEVYQSVIDNHKV